MCIHVATPAKSRLSLGKVHMATLRTSHGHTRDRVEACGPDRASSDQAWVSTSHRLHHTVYIIPSTSHRLHLPLCVYITPSTSHRLHHTVYIILSTSHRLHHTVYIIPLALPTGPQPVPVATLRTSLVSRERAAWHSVRCVIYIRVYMHM